MNLQLDQIPMQYRPAPFWSWNDKLDTQELRRQIRLMHEAGLGGFFMHARGGLQTEYLSEEWMECVNACLDEAGKTGMQAWLYDENGWPSGFGGGLVNGLGLAYQQKYLRHEILDAAEAAKRERTIAFYSPDGSTLLGRELPAGTTGKVLRCFFEVNCYYVDNLDPAVVREFLRVTHQHYYDVIPENLRKHLRGIFTDEPQLSRSGLLWSFVLEKEYRNAYGRELLPELPQLFIRTPESGAMRIRFWSLCARLFTESFMKQIREWCDAHHWEITGHHVLEENCRSQLSSNGAIMPQYRYYHVPGVDHLCRIAPSEVAAIQLASSAAAFGQKQLLTESFALTGWACHFSGMRWIYLQQMAHGINFLCPHLEGYTLRGLRKRDYPASAFYHQPWWNDYRKFTDCVSRVGMILTEGKQNTSVMVVHPISSAWKVYAGDDRDDRPNWYSRSLERLTKALDARQTGHHYADEYIVDEVGSVEGNVFRIGLASYRTVILPQLSNLSGKMARLIREFHENGGNVFAVRDLQEDGPFTIDGKAADREFLAFLRSLPSFHSEEAAAEAAARTLPDRVTVTESGLPASGIISTNRDVTLNGHAGRFHYFVNTCYHDPVRVRIALPASGEELEILDPVTGTLSVFADAVRENGKFVFEYTFAPASDACFFVTERSDLPLFKAHDLLAGNEVVRLNDTFLLKKHSGNLLTLDRCRYRINGGEWAACDIIDLQARLLARKKNCDLELETEFFCDEDFDFTQELELVTETPEKFRFALNGKAFAVQETGYLFDKAFRKIRLPEVRPGRNVLSLAIRYTQPQSVYDAIEAAKKFESEYNKLTFDTELESLYLSGDFSVRHHGGTENLDRNAVRLNGTFSLGGPLTWEKVKASDLIASGLPFFSGTLVLEQYFELTREECRAGKYLRLNLSGANSCKVRVNGQELPGCFWEAFEWKIGPYLQEGVNQIELELTTSLRNLLGPHHLQEGESYVVSTLSFNREPNVIGSIPPPYHPGYCFVHFGIQSPVLCTEQ